LGALFFSLPIALLAAAVAELIAILRSARRRSGSWPAALEQVIGGPA
jgi:hypothetical protein